MSLSSPRHYAVETIVNLNWISATDLFLDTENEWCFWAFHTSALFGITESPIWFLFKII